MTDSDRDILNDLIKVGKILDNQPVPTEGRLMWPYNIGCDFSTDRDYSVVYRIQLSDSGAIEFIPVDIHCTTNSEKTMIEEQAPPPIAQGVPEYENQNTEPAGPKLTPSDIESVIVDEQYHVFERTTLTVCCLTLANGFNVVGESACASPENFDMNVGIRIAKDNAIQKIWSLEGYLLKQKLSEVA